MDERALHAATGVLTLETDELVKGVAPELVTRFRWRAERRARKRNAERLFPFYRWEVRALPRGRWIVLAFQNVGLKT